MNKTQLKKEIRLHLNGSDRRWISLIIDEAIEIIISKIEKREKIKIKGLGTFFTRRARGWKIRNPKNGEWTKVPDRIKIRFRPSKKLERKINGR